MTSTTPVQPAKPLSLGVIFLTLYIDLIGFSIFFPVGPAMLEWYVNKESQGGLLAQLVSHLQALASAAHASDLATGALFAGALGDAERAEQAPSRSAFRMPLVAVPPVRLVRRGILGRRPATGLRREVGEQRKEKRFRFS